MKGLTIYIRYKRAEGTFHSYIRRASPRNYNEILDSCQKIEAKIMAIDECPPPYIITNLRVVIELRERCAADFEEDLHTKEAQTVNAVKRHRYWINLLKKALARFEELRSEHQGKTSKPSNKSVSDSKAARSSMNSFHGLKVEELLDEAVDDQPSSSEPSESKDNSLPDTPIPEEADDKIFRIWCHLKYLACGRDNLLRLLDETRQGRLSFEAFSVVCSTTCEHMYKVGQAFAEENPDLSAHVSVLAAIQVPVDLMSDEAAIRPLTKRESILVAEKGTMIVSVLRYAFQSGYKRGNTAPQYDGIPDRFCASVLEHFPAFLDIEKNTIFRVEQEWVLLSRSIQSGCCLSSLPFMVEVMAAAHNYFIDMKDTLYKNLVKASVQLHLDNHIQRQYAASRGYTILPLDEDLRYSHRKQYPKEVLEFSKTMILAVGLLTRRTKDLRYRENLNVCSQQGLMLAVCHLYCALQSLSMIAEGEIWKDMEFFLANFVPARARNFANHAYTLHYAKNLTPKSILSCFSIGVASSETLLEKNHVAGSTQSFRQFPEAVEISPASRIFVQAHEQEEREEQAGLETTSSLLPGYYHHFRTTLPSMKALIQQMREDEEEQDKFANFDLSPMLKIIQGGVLSKGGIVIKSVGYVLAAFAKKRKDHILLNVWHEMVSEVKKSGDEGSRGLHSWEESIKTFGAESREHDKIQFRKSASALEKKLAFFDEESKGLLQEVFADMRINPELYEARCETSTHDSRGELLDDEDA